jgi:prophage antirepressor-like protein
MNEIRHIEIYNEKWYLLKDICKILLLTNISETAKYISDKIGLSEGAFLRRVINDVFSNNDKEGFDSAKAKILENSNKLSELLEKIV